MIRSRTACLLIVFSLVSCADASTLAPAMKAVEQIRGRKFTGDVKNVAIDRADLAAHLEKQMRATTPYPLEDWGRVLRALQLIDVQGKEIVPKLLALYESQVLAFYDPQAHTYYSIKQLPKLPEGAAKLADPKVLEETVMVHELTHALQDQLFQLSKKEQSLMRDTDANMAYHAVLEGEAVLVMVAHMLQKNGVKIEEVIKDEAMLGMITSSVNADQMLDPATPKYFAEMLKFPYLDGLKFVVAAYRRGGWAELDKVHANPPRSTRELLHPEEYFARSFAATPFDPAKPQGAIAAEHLGEFHWRFLVGEDASRGWRNDRAVVFQDGRVQVDTDWDNEERATKFATAYHSVLTKRGLAAKVTRDGAKVHATYTAK
ncbi:MAG TPA: hypothetical protein VND45_05690 [Thermoanaerobaculia bacterium]|jgi:hypothetical protein|nr:hypothetical protein [Thermoanaerobaculia bacterium]